MVLNTNRISQLDEDAKNGVALRWRVPEPGSFFGIRSAKEVENFLWDIEMYYQLVQIPMEEQALVCAAYLSGDAKLWWRTQAALALLGEHQTYQLSWEEFKAELKKQFMPGNSSWAARETLFKLKHTGSIREYVKSYIALMLEIDDMTEQDRLYHFLAELQHWAQTELRRQKMMTLKEATLVADALVDLRMPEIEKKIEVKKAII